MFTRSHARQFGFTDSQIRRRVEREDWERLAPRVYRLTSAPDTRKALSSRGLITATSGLRTWQVDGHVNHRTLHIAVDGDQRPNDVLAVVHRVRGLLPDEGRIIDGIPVTRLERSVVDAVSILPVHELNPLVDAVTRQRLTTIDALFAEVERIGTRGRKNLGRLKTILAERDPAARVPDSRFNRLVGQLLVDAGLPEPEYEFVVMSGGDFVGRAYLAYRAAALLIECDSARWHQNQDAFQLDPRRRNRLALAGYQVLSFTWDDFRNRPSDMVAVVKAAYQNGARIRPMERNVS